MSSESIRLPRWRCVWLRHHKRRVVVAVMACLVTGAARWLLRSAGRRRPRATQRRRENRRDRVPHDAASQVGHSGSGWRRHHPRAGLHVRPPSRHEYDASPLLSGRRAYRRLTKRAARIVSCVRVSNGTEGQEGSWRGVLLASRMALTATALVGSASYASFYATKHLLGISSVWNGSLSAMPCKAIHTWSSV